MWAVILLGAATFVIVAIVASIKFMLWRGRKATEEAERDRRAYEVFSLGRRALMNLIDDQTLADDVGLQGRLPVDVLRGLVATARCFDQPMFFDAACKSIDAQPRFRERLEVKLEVLIKGRQSEEWCPAKRRQV